MMRDAKITQIYGAPTRSSAWSWPARCSRANIGPLTCGFSGRILQQDAAPRKPLTWDQREALIPAFETDIKLLGSVTWEDFSDWLGSRGDSGGLVGARPSGQRQARNGQPPS
jgi:hypothetical protein